MDRIDMMRAFREVARVGGFAPAARALGVSTSTLSRQIAGLEEWLGIQLLFRSTRSVRLTDAGQGYLARCVAILDDVGDMEQAGQEAREKLSGRVRLTAPSYYGRHVMTPILTKFLKAHPDVSAELLFHDRHVDMITEGFDLAIRITRPKDSTLIARRIDTVKLIEAAAPTYLEEHGVPQTIEELAQHHCIVDMRGEGDHRWEFLTESGKIMQPVSGMVRVNHGETARDLAIAGFGITRLPGFFLTDALAAGQLMQVLQAYPEDTAGIYVIYPPTRFISRTVRAVIDFLAKETATVAASDGAALE